MGTHAHGPSMVSTVYLVVVIGLGLVSLSAPRAVAGAVHRWTKGRSKASPTAWRINGLGFVVFGVLMLLLVWPLWARAAASCSGSASWCWACSSSAVQRRPSR